MFQPSKGLFIYIMLFHITSSICGWILTVAAAAALPACRETLPGVPFSKHDIMSKNEGGDVGGGREGGGDSGRPQTNRQRKLDGGVNHDAFIRLTIPETSPVSQSQHGRT